MTSAEARRLATAILDRLELRYVPPYGEAEKRVVTRLILEHINVTHNPSPQP